MNIAFINGKGGVGKSTLCFLTTLGLLEAGKTVTIQDLDPQKSLSAWLSGGQDGILPSGAEFTLTDTRPAIDDPSVLAAIQNADRIVMPCTPSPADLGALKASIQVVNQTKRPQAKVFLALNSFRKGTNFSEDSKDILSTLGVPILKTTLPLRQSIQRSVLLGWKALEPEIQASIFNLTLEIIL